MRHRTGIMLVASLAMFVAASTSYAHHSVAGQFDSNKPLTLKGVVSKVEWINPHIYVFLDVKDGSGTTTTWALATLPTAMMRRAGLTKETVTGKPGEVITVDAIAARDGTKHLAWINKITYADGHLIQLAGQ